MDHDTRLKSARVLLISSLSLWVGGLATISLLLIPAALMASLTREQAKELACASLRTFGWIELVCAAVAFGSSLYVRRTTGKGKVTSGLITLMLLTSLWCVGFVYPEAASWAKSMHYSGPGLDIHNFPLQFSNYFRASMALVGLNIVLGTFALFAAIGMRRDGP